MGIFVSLQDHGHDPCIEQGFKPPTVFQLLIHSEHSVFWGHLGCSKGEKTVIMDRYIQIRHISVSRVQLPKR